MLADVEGLLRDYVERNSGICCAQWDPAVSERLLFDPYDADNGAWAAHYFLLNAAVTETALIGRAENAKALMVWLHRRFRGELLRQTDEKILNEAVKRCGFYRDFGGQRLRIGAVLAGVNRWVEEEAGGDLLGFSKGFSSPVEYAGWLQGIIRMGGGHCEKVWMYLRWLTRPHLDLGVPF